MTGGPRMDADTVSSGGGGDAARSGLRIQRVGRDRLGDALRVMAHQPTGYDREALSRDHLNDHGSSTRPNVEAGREGDAEVDALCRGLWMALRDDRPTAVVSIQRSAGRTAMVFVSAKRPPVAGPPCSEDGDFNALQDASALVRAACAAEPPDHVRLFQALLRSQDRATRDILTKAGFQFLAALTYMQRRTCRGPSEPALPDGIEIQTYHPSLRDEFAQAIEASYQHTLDCPALVGMREIDDVLDGHMGAGPFREDLWLLVRDHGRPAGVMLLGLVHGGRAAELVYLGLGPTVRGRGLGRTLLEYGLALARRAGADKMMLAVDQQNTPALALYDSLRFVPVTRRTAMVMAGGVSSLNTG